MANISADLGVALTQLAEEFTLNAPPEVLRAFPTWATELPNILRTQGKDELLNLLGGLEQQEANEPGVAIAHAFAKNALRAALEIHDGGIFGLVDGSGGPSAGHVYRGGTSTRDAFVTSTRAPAPRAWEIDLESLVADAINHAPPEVRSKLANFDAELNGLLHQPLPQLRAVVARLETAHADIEIRRFMDESLCNDPAVGLEAAALGYTVHALNAVLNVRSAAEMALKIRARRQLPPPSQGRRSLPSAPPVRATPIFSFASPPPPARHVPYDEDETSALDSPPAPVCAQSVTSQPGSCRVNGGSTFKFGGVTPVQAQAPAFKFGGTAGQAFNFNKLYEAQQHERERKKNEAPGDAFNPCCDGLDPYHTSILRKASEDIALWSLDEASKSVLHHPHMSPPPQDMELDGETGATA